MVDILHRVGIAAAPAEVYDALATTEGVARWWTTKVDGDSAVGGTLRFYFANPEPSATMEVTELTPDQAVKWRCVDGPAEWVGTDVVFELEEADGETVVSFAHANWREPLEFMRHCSTKWAYFLLGLKSGLEGGAFRAFPDDEKISSWG